MRKNDAFVMKIVITRLTKGFMAIFAPAEILPSPATLTVPRKFSIVCFLSFYLQQAMDYVISVDLHGWNKIKTESLQTLLNILLL